MSYKIAGIDVHKKVLMVVVIDASTPEGKPQLRRFAIRARFLPRCPAKRRLWEAK